MVVEDIIDTWPIVLAALIGSMFVCLIFIAIMRWLAAPVIWFSIFGVMALLGTGIYFSYLKFDYLNENPVERPPPTTNVSALFEAYLLRKVSESYLPCVRVEALLLFELFIGNVVVHVDRVIDPLTHHHSHNHYPA